MRHIIQDAVELLREQSYEMAGANLYPVILKRHNVVTVSIENNRLLVVNRSTGEIKGELHIELNMERAA